MKLALPLPPSSSLLASTLAVLLATGAARAGDAGYEEKSKTISNRGFQVELRWFEVTLSDRKLAKEVNANLKAAVGANDLAQFRGGGEPRQHIERWCTPAFVSDDLLSWACGAMEYSESYDGGQPGGYSQTVETHRIVDGALAPIGLDDLFGDTSDLRARIGKTSEVEVSYKLDLAMFTIDGDAISWWPSEGNSDPEVTIELDKLAPILKGPVGQWLLSPPVPLEPTAPKAPPGPTPLRPVASPGAPVVGANGLEWSAEDNGYDTNWDGARAWVAAYRGGGHDDWRLPSAAELQTLLEKDSPNKPADGCEGGKHSYRITAKIHVTCGLLWSADADGKQATGLGLITGKVRRSPLDATKNYRVIAVRKAP